MSRASAIAVRICDENVGRCALLFARLPEKAHRRAKRHENAAAVSDTAPPENEIEKRTSGLASASCRHAGDAPQRSDGFRPCLIKNGKSRSRRVALASYH